MVVPYTAGAKLRTVGGTAPPSEADCATVGERRWEKCAGGESGTIRDGLFFLGLCGRQIVVSPRAGLRSGDDSGDVGVLTVGGPGGRALPALGFLTSAGFFLLAFLLRTLSRALLLCDFGSIRHRQVPFQLFARAWPKSSTSTPVSTCNLLNRPCQHIMRDQPLSLGWRIRVR
jgi:hypothetical protein